MFQDFKRILFYKAFEGPDETRRRPLCTTCCKLLLIFLAFTLLFQAVLVLIVLYVIPFFSDSDTKNQFYVYQW